MERNRRKRIYFPGELIVKVIYVLGEEEEEKEEEEEEDEDEGKEEKEKGGEDFSIKVTNDSFKMEGGKGGRGRGGEGKGRSQYLSSYSGDIPRQGG